MKNFLFCCLVATLLGGFIGYLTPIIIPTNYSKLFSVAILAGVESIFSAIKLIIREKFNAQSFILNFLANVFIVVVFVFVGDNLGLDLYYVVLLAIGFRLLQDLDVIRLHLFNR